MLKKYAGMVVIGFVLAGCNEIAGGTGYFDQTPPPADAGAPVNLVPETSATSQSSAEALAGTLETAIDAGTAPTDATTTDPATNPVATGDPATDPAATAGIATDDGSLDLNAETFDQQVVLREAAAKLLAEARAKYTIIEPGTLPKIVAGVNIAEYARTTTNKVGQRLYSRPVIKNRFSSVECRKYATPDDAQRYFLANGGPEKDPLNLDPDGDGFACRWSPEPFRMLK